MTTRLYYDDSYLTTFTATVVAVGAHERRPAVVLDRSAFYPEGGGQPADHGSVNGVPVVDVQVVDGVVWHVLSQDRAPLAVGDAVEGQVDWARRRDHMQQHCGQHLLTAAFIAVGGPATVAFHLSEREATIDLASEPSEELVRAAESLANEVVWEDRAILARFVSSEELAQISLRKAASVQGAVRVVSIADFDHSACGGTHPRSTGGVGQISVLGWARQRGGARVRFVCGGRALAELRRLGVVATSAASALSVGLDELPAAAERAVANQKALAKTLSEAQGALDAAEALRLYGAAEQVGEARLVCAELAGLGPERLRAVAQTVAAQPGGVAMLGSEGARASLVVACAATSGRDARLLLQAGLPHVAGRGGGNAQLAQGGGEGGSGLQAALAAMLAAARDK